ncbi:MAG: hypothetical protein AVDCRST_MAG89-4727 [uncultured Gemmatimonadetes bacterium]|uniref:Uncharacterized protein n=1 Tax=uncultured Gemmatimonadota bacterium TaxID=203437 RepID=A0A6J4MYX0_9BACT|nr:MAG: hypothetical protein AVDCRST_MAG89-4727 [uncultured Gemmatimonadota bacterium]
MRPRHPEFLHPHPATDESRCRIAFISLRHIHLRISTAQCQDIDPAPMTGVHVADVSSAAPWRTPQTGEAT